jgi:hypothetical protein
VRGLRGALAIVAVMLAGCVPFPHFDYYAPPTIGVVTQDGHPVVGAVLQMNSRSLQNTSTTRTNAAGEFAIAPIRVFHLTTFILGDRVVTYELDIDVDGKEYLGYLDSEGNTDSKLILGCDLGTPVPRYRTNVYCTEVGRK